MRNKYKGFTLIELLVVISIISLLSSVLLSSINVARQKARDARRDIDIKTIQTALASHYSTYGSYPVGGWRTSHASTWTSLETTLGTTLPKDPTNENGGYSYSGWKNYSYFAHSGSGYCSGQAYILVYNKETVNGNGPNDGVRLCDGSLYTYGNAFVVGVSPVN